MNKQKHLSSIYGLLFILCFAYLGASETVYHITPTSDDHCAPPCLTLHQLATAPSHYLRINATLFLLPGKHILSTELEIANMTSFTMTSMNTIAQIQCENLSSISFHSSQSILLTSVEFLGCGGNRVRDVNEFILSDATFEGQEGCGTALELIDTNVELTNTSFLSNTNGSFRHIRKQLESIRAIFGAQGIEINTYDTWIGGAIVANCSNISISSSTFENNSAIVGGVMFVQNSSITINNTTFIENRIKDGQPSQFLTIAGVIYQENSHTMLTNCHFDKNHALIGGSIFAHQGSLKTYNSSFSSNRATYGGALFSAFATLTLQGRFINNNADYGGVFRSYFSSAMIVSSQFDANNATFGGVILSFSSSISVNKSEFLNNNAIIAGSVLVAASTTIKYDNHLHISNNSAAEFGVMYLSECNISFQGNATFENNFGALLAIYSNVTFSGHVAFKNNSQPLTPTILNFQDGGALSLFQSNAVFDGECTFENNRAENGGAIHSVESELYVNGKLAVELNMARENGGGIYLSQSELTCLQKGILKLSGNVATQRGGGIHAISSTVQSTSSDKTNVRFVQNSAKEGGGIYLETNAKLYVHKLAPFDSVNKAVHFVENSANYGGAIYVNDNTNSATCTAKSSECFFRVVYNSYIIITPNIPTIFFEYNVANTTGSTLYGGLLDRCVVSPFARVNIYAINAYRLDIDGVLYFKDVSSEINSSSISSLPTKLCHCVNNLPDCRYKQYKPITIKKGQTFSVSVVAVDQIGNPVDAVIQSILKFNSSGLGEGQLTRNIPDECTELNFNVISPENNEILSLYASNGPCNDAQLSTLHQEITFLPCNCPIGFQPSEMNVRDNCSCDCHEDINVYMTCDPFTELLMKQAPSNVWISYVNHTDVTGYLVYPNCPYGYCNPHSTPISLTKDNGEDMQCAFNRSRLLCGSCQPSLSLSLGSPHCLSCPNHWPVLFVSITIAALLAGILLIAILLVLNMTVEVGTLNGLIFYINIVAVNRSVLLPFEEHNFITVLVSWLNFDLGIETCYFPGLDAYTKAWIQLSFVVLYVIFLIVFAMVITSSYSSRFTDLIRKKNPVATISTLVFLSHIKLLEIIFTALSVSIIDYPDSSSLKVWRPNAIVKYLQGKHIALFITALVLLAICLVYSTLLFCWQWLLCLPSWRILNWTKNPKLQAFIETYHAPYIKKHGYWTGMLLFVRTVLYLITAFNVLNFPQVTLASIIFIVGFVLSIKGFIGRLYQKWSIDILETFFYFNLLALALFAFYFLNRVDKYKPVAYVSVVITFVLLVIIILYHMYAYVVPMTKLGQRISTVLHSNKKSDRKNSSQQHEILDMKLQSDE